MKTIRIILCNAFNLFLKSFCTKFIKFSKPFSIISLIFIPRFFCRNLKTISKENNSFDASIFVMWNKALLESRARQVRSCENAIFPLRNIRFFSSLNKYFLHSIIKTYIIISRSRSFFLNKLSPET